MLRVGFIVTKFPQVSEVFIMNTAAALLEKQCEIEIFAFGGPGNPEVLNAPGRKHDLLSRTHVVTDFMGGRMDRLRSALPMLHSMALKHGISFAASSLSLRHHRRGALSLQSLAELALLRSRPEVDVLHCQFGTLGERLRRHVAAGGIHVPLVVHFRGHDLGPYVQRQGDDVYRALFAGDHHYIANSAFFRARAIDLGCPPDRICVIESPVDADSFVWRVPTPPQGRPLQLLTVGRLVEKKGIADAIEAAAVLRARGHDFRYRIIGEGILRPALQALIDHHGLGDRVTLTGSCAHPEVAAALTNADLFLAPSVQAGDGDADAAVNTIKEAMLVGVPVVATRHGGIPELVRDGQSGLLVAERDAPALADAIETLIRQPERWQPMAEAGRASVVSRFAMPSIADQTIAVYRKAIDAHRRHPVRRSRRLEKLSQGNAG